MRSTQNTQLSICAIADILYSATSKDIELSGMGANELATLRQNLDTGSKIIKNRSPFSCANMPLDVYGMAKLIVNLSYQKEMNKEDTRPDIGKLAKNLINSKKDVSKHINAAIIFETYSFDNPQAKDDTKLQSAMEHLKKQLEEYMAFGLVDEIDNPIIDKLNEITDFYKARNGTPLMQLIYLSL